MTAGIAENAAVFLDSIRVILDDRAGEVGALKFDKDDQQALQTCCSVPFVAHGLCDGWRPDQEGVA